MGHTLSLQFVYTDEPKVSIKRLAMKMSHIVFLNMMMLLVNQFIRANLVRFDGLNLLALMVEAMDFFYMNLAKIGQLLIALAMMPKIFQFVISSGLLIMAHRQDIIRTIQWRVKSVNVALTDLICLILKQQ